MAEPRQNRILQLVRQQSWNLEDFTAFLKLAARKRRELVFYGKFSDKLNSSLSLVAIFKLKDPRADILNFVTSYPAFNAVEASYYKKIFKPVLDEMILREPNCIHSISSSNFVKKALMQAVLSRFNVEPYFISFAERLQGALESRIVN